MRVLRDHCVDVHFGKLLIGHEIHSAKEMGWQSYRNGKLLTAAEEAGFTVMVTTDKNLRYQQNISKRKISLITLNSLLVDYDYIAPMAFPLMLILKEGLAPGSEIVIDP